MGEQEVPSKSSRYKAQPQFLEDKRCFHLSSFQFTCLPVCYASLCITENSKETQNAYIATSEHRSGEMRGLITESLHETVWEKLCVPSSRGGEWIWDEQREESKETGWQSGGHRWQQSEGQLAVGMKSHRPVLQAELRLKCKGQGFSYTFGNWGGNWVQSGQTTKGLGSVTWK